MIVGVSDKRRLPRAGKIRLGEKALSDRTGNPYPRAVDYFVWPEEYAEKLNRLFGEKAREIDIMFPVEDIEQIAPQYLKRYGASGLSCRGDGVTAERVDESGDWVEVECNPQECPDYREGKCRRVMNLRFIIPQLISEGVFQIDTSSYHTIVNINSGIDYVKALVGRIAMVPLKLRIVPREVQPGGRKKVVHVLEVKLASTIGLEEIRRLASEERPVLALPSLQDQAPPDDLFPVEAAEYAALKAQDVEVQEDAQDLRENVRDNETPEPEEPDAPEPEVDEVDARIAELFDLLNFTVAKQRLFRRRYPDPAELLQQLEDMAKRRGGQASPPSDTILPSNPASPSPALF